MLVNRREGTDLLAERRRPPRTEVTNNSYEGFYNACCEKFTPFLLV